MQRLHRLLEWLQDAGSGWMGFMVAAEKSAASQRFVLPVLNLWLGIQSRLIVVAHLVPILGSVLGRLCENIGALNISERLSRMLSRGSGVLT